MKRKLLVTQLENHIKQLRAEDHALVKFGFDGQNLDTKELA